MATKKTEPENTEPTLEERVTHLETLAAKHGWGVVVPEPEEK